MEGVLPGVGTSGVRKASGTGIEERFGIPEQIGRRGHGLSPRCGLADTRTHSRGTQRSKIPRPSRRYLWSELVAKNPLKPHEAGQMTS